MPPTAPPPGVEKKHDQGEGRAHTVLSTCSGEILDFRRAKAKRVDCVTTISLLYLVNYTTQESTCNYNAHCCGRNPSFVHEVCSLHLHYYINIVYTIH